MAWKTFDFLCTNSRCKEYHIKKEIMVKDSEKNNQICESCGEVLRADFTNNNKVVKLAGATTGALPLTTDVLQASTKPTVAKGIYKLYSFCASTQGYVLAAELPNGNKYYSLNGATSVQNNAIDVVNPCPGLGVASATTIYFGMPTTSCANENGTCTFSDTATIAYGSLAVGRFTARKGQTSPVTCSNAYFGDPASGFAKACYVLSY
jgi:hypothetical protein